MCERDFLRMCLISPTECVWFMGVLEGQEAVQLRVSIFINFKVFHTPHPFLSTIHSYTVCLFSQLKLGMYGDHAIRGETIQSCPNGNSTIKT